MQHRHQEAIRAPLYTVAQLPPPCFAGPCQPNKYVKKKSEFLDEDQLDFHLNMYTATFWLY